MLQSVPMNLYHRMRASWMELVRAWPRCSVPVTLGGGSSITNFPGLPSVACKHNHWLSKRQQSLLEKTPWHLIRIVGHRKPLHRVLGSGLPVTWTLQPITGFWAANHMNISANHWVLGCQSHEHFRQSLVLGCQTPEHFGQSQGSGLPITWTFEPITGSGLPITWTLWPITGFWAANHMNIWANHWVLGCQSSEHFGQSQGSGLPITWTLWPITGLWAAKSPEPFSQSLVLSCQSPEHFSQSLGSWLPITWTFQPIRMSQLIFCTEAQTVRIMLSPQVKAQKWVEDCVVTNKNFSMGNNGTLHRWPASV